jgi:hypothetical protein
VGGIERSDIANVHNTNRHFVPQCLPHGIYCFQEGVSFFPSYCHDLTPLYQSLEAENVPKNESAHDALEDAIWNYKVWALAKGK